MKNRILIIVSVVVVVAIIGALVYAALPEGFKIRSLAAGYGVDYMDENGLITMADGGTIKFEVVSTSPIGATVRATIDGSPSNVQMVVLNLDDIRNGIEPAKARQQEIKYSEVNKITTETKEISTPIMGERNITIDDVLAKVSAPIEDELKEPTYSKEVVTYLESIKVANTTTSKVGGADTSVLSTAVTSKTELLKTLTTASKDIQPEIDKLMLEMPATLSDVVSYDVKTIEQEVKTSIMTSKVASESKIFDVSEPMILEATVTSGGWESKAGWGASGVVALIIDGEYYYDMSHSSWYSTAYAHRLQFTVPSSLVDADCTNFPVKLWLSTSSGTNTADLTAFFNAISYADRLKIAVTDSTNTNQYYVEIVSGSTEWTAKTVEMYTAVPVYHASNTVYNLYYDSSQSANTTYVGDTTSTAAKAVWDSSFVAVYHMNDKAGDSTKISDSTTNNNEGTKGASTAAPAEATGLKGKAQSFDGSNDYIDCGNSASFSITGARTQEAIGKLDSSSTGLLDWFGKGNTFSGSKSEGFAFGTNNAVATSDQYSTTVRDQLIGGSLTLNTYYYLCDWWDGTTTLNHYKIYIDTTPTNGTASIASVAFGSFNYTIGTRSDTHAEYFYGTLDEIRISNTARSTAWIKATNYSERDTLISWGSETSISVPSVTTSVATSVTATTATLNGNVTNANNGDLTVHGFQWDVDSGAPYANDWNEAGTSTGAYSHGVTSLPSSTTIYFRAYATNQAGTGYGSEVSFTTESGMVLPSPPTNFSVTQTGLSEVTLSWTLGNASNMTVIRGSTTSYPATNNVAFPVYSGSSNTTVISGLELTSNEYYFSAWGINGTYVSSNKSQATIGGENMQVLSANMAIIGEWGLILAIIALAMWRHEKLLYLGFCIPLFIEGLRWFTDYKLVGIFLILSALYFLYQAIVGYLASNE